MIYLAIGALLVLLWMWMRSSPMRRGGWRVGGGLLALVLVIVGAALSIRGDWFIGLPLVLLGVGLATTSRINRDLGRRRPAPNAPAGQGMTAAEARSILGVAQTATIPEIQAAYTRLMKRAHPDSGGSTGLATQLNAARDRLLKG